MTLAQLKNVNFGKQKANLANVGYTILDVNGDIAITRSTADVYQIAPGSGLYAAFINFPNDFKGQILWDTGEALGTIAYAVEQYNVEENDPKVALTYTTVQTISGSVEVIRDFTEGRWQIVANQMIFFKSDNVTEVARFDLHDAGGNPTMDAVFERLKVP
jgi:hypothetical protein